MADVKKMATRDGYGKGLVALGAEHEDVVVLDADLAGSTKTGMFAKAYPDRHFNCGIAEGNMMAVAAGLAAAGMTPFASSFAMFASGRAFEQIRNSIGYPALNVKIGATHGGLSVGEDGASHQCCEDFALMRSIPGMTIICPADGVEAEAATKAAYAHEGPVYLRFGRLAVPVFHEEGFEFVIGKGEINNLICEHMFTMLKEKGYYYGDLTGSFGSLTKRAVRQFQDDNDLTVDGIAGKKTQNKLYGTNY